MTRRHGPKIVPHINISVLTTIWTDTPLFYILVVLFCWSEPLFLLQKKFGQISIYISNVYYWLFWLYIVFLFFLCVQSIFTWLTYIYIYIIFGVYTPWFSLPVSVIILDVKPNCTSSRLISLLIPFTVVLRYVQSQVVIMKAYWSDVLSIVDNCRVKLRDRFINYIFNLFFHRSLYNCTWQKKKSPDCARSHRLAPRVAFTIQTPLWSLSFSQKLFLSLSFSFLLKKNRLNKQQPQN